MAYNSISIITLIELAPSPSFFVQSICLAYMNMFARFDENPAMTLQDIKETKRYRRTDNVKTDYPPQTKFAGFITQTCIGESSKISKILVLRKSNLKTCNMSTKY